MNFPIIHTNFWDALIAIPVIMILTQLIKIYFKIPNRFIPPIALIIGLLISIFISHRHNLVAGIFMGWFYGYAAIGNYAALKTSLIAYRNK
ncbi:hypothetical protein KD050_03665 [Psychrobacillus sp. INOP01]|uniref:hypothetical protein n=1 Tax=Psychrobacillus sp. INOP01 TaxID=2829187 RepID=UPI001BA5A07D|nr:hypothetical protein [Psychrobacillus sp. INOP01]QUG42399.1 hypothetical protein KD050_03665 [Psychrobacillus sp. INOP01]